MTRAHDIDHWMETARRYRRRAASIRVDRDLAHAAMDAFLARWDTLSSHSQARALREIVEDMRSLRGGDAQEQTEHEGNGDE